ncbi:MAG: hypothetical protein J7M39_08675, partial [Anaerolineae bacterium]|nr:hypothetical protein [Anaerolineae bacterium]
ASYVTASAENGAPEPPPPQSWNVDLVGEISGGATAVFWVDDLLYVAAGDKLVILDVAGPARASLTEPREVGVLAVPTGARDVTVVGDYAYVAARTGGLLVVDVADPANPTLVATTTGILHALAVDVAGDYAYVADRGPYMRIVDVSDPLSPTLVGSYRPGISGWYIVDVTVSGTVAYAGYSSELFIVDVTTPTQPVEISRYPTRAYDTEVVGTMAYVAAGSDGFRLIDVSEPATPTLVSTYDTPYSVFASALSGTVAYVADGATGLLSIDITEPMTPTEVGRQDTPGVAQDVALSGPYAFVADSARGVRILDVGNATAPREVSAYDLPSASRSVAVSGTHAFVGEYYYSAGASESLGVLRAIDLSSPAMLTQTDVYTLPDRGIDVVVQGPYAYVAANGSGLQIVDVSNPSALSFVGEVDTLKLAFGIAVSGTMVYVADSSGGLRVVDASNATAPVEVGSLAGDVASVALKGHYAFLAGRYGMRVADISEPMTPTQVATYSLSYAPDVVVSGTLAYVAAGGECLHVVDISDPLSPTQVAVVPSVEASGVQVLGNKLYVVAGDSGDGLTVMDISSPEDPRMIGFHRASTMGYKDVALLDMPDSVDPYMVVAAGGDGLVVFRIRYRIYLPVVMRQLSMP